MLGCKYWHRACPPFPEWQDSPPLAWQRAAGLYMSQSPQVADSLLTSGQSCHVLPAPPPRVGLGHVSSFLSVSCVSGGHFFH